MDKPLKVAPGGVIEKVGWLCFSDTGKVWFAISDASGIAYTIGGKIEPGETLEDALVREVREEASVELIRTSIRFMYRFDGPCHGYVEGTKLVMHCYGAAYVGTLRPGHEVKKLVMLDSRSIGTGATTIMGDDILRRCAKDRHID